MNQRQIAFACLAFALLGVAPASAQNYPNRPIRLVVPYPPGGGTDIFARTVAPRMGEALGQQVVVENKPGASGIIAADFVAKGAPADGYTVLLGDTGQYALNSSLYKKLPYDALTDFAPVTLTARFEFAVAVNPQALPVTSVAQLIEAARKSPNGLFYASPGAGVPHHLAAELFGARTGIKLSAIQYKGGAPAMQALLAGEAPLMIVDMTSGLPLIKSGKVRALAALTDKRIDVMPDLPTIAEVGFPGVVVYAWQGLAVRTGTPAPVITALNAAYRRAAEDAGVRKALLERGGMEFIPGTPAQMAEMMKTETARWREVIQRANIALEQ